MNLKLKNYPFWICCLCFAFGVFLSQFITGYLVFKIGITIVITAFSFITKSKNRVFLVSIYCLFALLGILKSEISLPKYNKNHINNRIKNDLPKAFTFKITEQLKTSDKAHKYIADLLSYDKSIVTGKILVASPSTDSQLKIGDHFLTYSKLKPLQKSGNPYAFEYSEYLKNKDVYFKVWLPENQLFSIASKDLWLTKTNYKLKNHLKQQISKLNLDDKVKQITKALILGDKSSMDTELKTDFSNAGVIHILAISGLHIGIIYFVLNFLFSKPFQFLKIKVPSDLIIVCLLWLFTWFTGLSPSAVRTTTMFSCIGLAKLLDRKQHPINGLFFSILLLLYIKPNYLWNVGFQLSVLAVASIILGMPLILKFWYPKNKLLRGLWSIIGVSLCAQIGVLGISLLYFHQFPVLFLVANIPVLAFINLFLIAAIALSFLSAVSLVPSWYIDLYNHLFNFLIDYIHWVSNLEFSVIKNIYLHPISVWVYYGLLIYFALVIVNKRRALKFVCIPIGLVIISIFIETKAINSKNELWVLNTYNNLSLAHISSNQLQVYSTNIEQNKDYLIEPIIGNLHIKNTQHYDLHHFYKFNDQSICVLDSKDIVSPYIKNAILILDQNPKINLDILVKKYSPKMIIASYNNYNKLTKKWKATCKKSHVAFYNIKTQGALELSSIINLQK